MERREEKGGICSSFKISVDCECGKKIETQTVM